jgi:hypothetical protein
MGKSSILVRTRHLLQQQGYRCSTLDMSRIGSENISPEQWYKGIVTELWRGFNLLGKINLKTWWRDFEDLSFLQRLGNFIEDVLLVKLTDDKIVIFIDEIDSILSLYFPIDDFLAWVRFCYNQRYINTEYNRLTFAIFGVATPRDLIADKKRTPFNIGTAIELQGFQLHEAQPLALGLEGKVSNPQAVVKEILAWTGGQPFLNQKLCQLVTRIVEKRAIESEEISDVLTIPPGHEAFWVENVVRQYIIQKWESQDEPEHLRTIRDRILCNSERAARLLGIYQQILQSDPPLISSRFASELLRPPRSRGAGEQRRETHNSDADDPPLAPPCQGGGQEEPPAVLGGRGDLRTPRCFGGQGGSENPPWQGGQGGSENPPLFWGAGGI